MMVWVIMCYASDIIEYDRRISELSNAPLHTKQDTTSIEKYPLTSQTQTKTYILTCASPKK